MNTFINIIISISLYNNRYNQLTSLAQLTISTIRYCIKLNNQMYYEPLLVVSKLSLDS